MHRCCLYVYESDITGLRGGRRRKGEERGRAKRERGGGKKEEEKSGGKGREGGMGGRKREGYGRERGKERSVEKARGSYMLGEGRQSAV